MKLALGSGFIGACGVTLLNFIGQRFLPAAPRLDLLGMRMAAGVMKRTGVPPPKGLGLKAIALAGDLVSNSIFYALVGMGSPRTAWLRGGALGLAAGVGAATLPEPLGLGKSSTERSPKTQATTIAWYVAGGLLAAALYASSHRARSNRD